MLSEFCSETKHVTATSIAVSAMANCLSWIFHLLAHQMGIITYQNIFTNYYIRSFVGGTMGLFRPAIFCILHNRQYQCDREAVLISTDRVNRSHTLCVHT